MTVIRLCQSIIGSLQMFTSYSDCPEKLTERSWPMHFSINKEHSIESRKVRRSSCYNELSTSRPISPRATLQATDPDILPPSSPGLGVLGDINSTSSTIILWRSSFLLFSDTDVCLCNSHFLKKSWRLWECSGPSLRKNILKTFVFYGNLERSNQVYFHTYNYLENKKDSGKFKIILQNLCQ